MVLPESLLVVMASTLAGGLERHPSHFLGNLTNTTCRAGTRWLECHTLDELIQPIHILVPWCITLCTLVILSMPTVLLRSRSKEQGLRVVASNTLLFLCLLLCSTFATDSPSLCFVLSLHACVRLLVQLEVSSVLVGGRTWWSLRYVAAGAILALELCLGPSISIVRWPTTRPGSALSCAYLAHLGGCILPDLVISKQRWLMGVLGCIQARDHEQGLAARRSY
jgi:hypothetical protein